MQVIILSITDFHAKPMLGHTLPMHASSAILHLMLMLNKQKDQSRGVLSAVEMSHGASILYYDVSYTCMLYKYHQTCMDT